jgi:O-antigen/teichoic acid export membrane protein
LRRALPDIAVLPRWRDFAWPEVRINIGYGINGLFLVAVSAFTLLLVSRWIIDARGLDANGVFSVAWKVSSVYFGAIYASASSFYFPSLVACRDDAELGARINEAISLYFYALPPLIVGLLIAGEDLMRLLFSAQFVPAALLLLGWLPGDLFRVLAEAQGMAFLARRRLLPYTATYVLWAGAFLGFAHLGLQRYGVAGVALAYFAAQIVSALAVHACTRAVFAYRIDAATARRIGLGLGAVAAASCWLLGRPALPWRYAGGGIVLALWLALAWRDAAFRDLFQAARRKLAARFAPAEARDV